MKNEFDYQEVPYDFAHCLNDQCTQVNHCLRHLAAANSTSIRKFFPIVNPAHYPKERDKCPFFKSQIKKRIALGITNLLDNVPHKTALLLRRQMVEHFGKHFITVSCARKTSYCPNIKFLSNNFLNRTESTKNRFSIHTGKALTGKKVSANIF